MENIFLKGSPDFTNSMLPTSYIYEDSDGAREFDLRTLHLCDGVIFINVTIDRDTAMRFASSMLLISAEKRDVRIYINNDGGEVNAGLMIYDIMQSFGGNMEVFCIDRAASMAAVLLAGVQKGGIGASHNKPAYFFKRVLKIKK